MPRNPNSIPARGPTTFGLLSLCLYALLQAPTSTSLWAQNEQPPAADKAAANKPAEALAVLVQVPLPLTGNVDQLVQKQIDRALKRLPKDAKRPTLILEFRAPPDGVMAGSDFGRAHTLAKFLVSDVLAQVKTVAYLPHSVQGHAVLPVLACEQIVMAKEAELGAAGVDEKLLDETMRGAYREFAQRRRTLPAAIALGMLDSELEVFKVSTNDGIRYEASEALAGLRAQGVVTKEETVFRAGETHTLSGNEMRFHGFATHLVEDKSTLAAALQLPPTALRALAVPEEGWRPIRVDIDGPVTNQKVSWVKRVVEDHRQKNDFNLLCLFITSGGGNITESMELASFLAELDKDVRTVAFVPRQALADAGLIAWACDDLIIGDNVTIGGPGDVTFSAAQREAAQAPLQRIASLRQRNWSLPLAMIDPQAEVWPYQRAGSPDMLYLSPAEWAALDNNQEWQRGPSVLRLRSGIDTKTAVETGLATHVVQNQEEFKSLYHLEGDLPSAKSNWALAAIEWLADPKLAAMLLFIATFALMVEFSSPGLGVAGFISLLCFVLYFSSQFLHGNATGLEICLFIGGIACVFIEIFVVPGTFVFGVGGGLMIVSSIVLASQTFVVPSNTYQLNQMPISLTILVVGIAGGIAAIAAIRRFLPDTPYLNRMMLKPPQHEELEERLEREQLVHWAHLAGKRGTTTTALFPSGKALFGDHLVDVVSAGEMIPKGADVVVTDVIGSRVLVREVS
ncbi:NfeD family protein [Anatilimnocola sp. NA78]|uniref:NfeD family protein n=1 Tax=Anatilimnocola sp. NA78 TaxID=3415683 RepID=UPI003CE56142